MLWLIKNIWKMFIQIMLLYSFQMVTRTKKIFVGGLSAPTTLEDVKSYFEQFGPVSLHPLFIANAQYITPNNDQV